MDGSAVSDAHLNAVLDLDENETQIGQSAEDAVGAA
jgi:hypothetical protein